MSARSPARRRRRRARRRGALDGGGDAGRDASLEHPAAPRRRVQRGGGAVLSLVAHELRGDAPRGGAGRAVQRDREDRRVARRRRGDAGVAKRGHRVGRLSTHIERHGVVPAHRGVVGREPGRLGGDAGALRHGVRGVEDLHVLQSPGDVAGVRPGEAPGGGSGLRTRGAPAEHDLAVARLVRREGRGHDAVAHRGIQERDFARRNVRGDRVEGVEQPVVWRGWSGLALVSTRRRTAVRGSREKERRARVSRIRDGDAPFRSARSCETSALERLGERSPPSLDATEEARVARVAGPTGFRPGGKQPSARDLTGTTATPLEVRAAEGCGVGGAEATIGGFDWETPMVGRARRAVTAGSSGREEGAWKRSRSKFFSLPLSLNTSGSVSVFAHARSLNVDRAPDPPRAAHVRVSSSSDRFFRCVQTRVIGAEGAGREDASRHSRWWSPRSCR